MELLEVEDEKPSSKKEEKEITKKEGEEEERKTSELEEQKKKRIFPFKKPNTKFMEEEDNEEENAEEAEEEDEEATFQTENGELKFIESLEYIKHHNEEEEKIFHKKYRLYFTVFTDENTKIFNGEDVTDEQEIDMSI